MRIVPRSPWRLWLLALLPFSAVAQHQEADLTARGKVERIQLCQVDADMAWMDLDLHLVVENTGHERIILPRAAPVVYYWKTAPDMETLAYTRLLQKFATIPPGERLQRALRAGHAVTGGAHPR